MPFEIPFMSQSLNSEAFSTLDYEVMKHAFASHKEVGRLCDEKIYQADLAARLTQSGHGVQREVRAMVRHQDFVKEYLLDLLVTNGAIYELKTVSAIAPEHETQLMNYLFICGIKHGKIINFRSSSVQARFVNNVVSHSDQRRFITDTREWRILTERCGEIPEIVGSLCKDWGAFLEGRLYRDAVVHFLGGTQKVLHSLPVKRDNLLLGHQSFHLVSADVALHFSSASYRLPQIKSQLQRLLELTPLRAIQWINLARHSLQFATIVKA